MDVDPAGNGMPTPTTPHTSTLGGFNVTYPYQVHAARTSMEPTAKQRSKWLTDEAKNILKNFFFNVSRYPTSVQKDDLVSQIRQFEGFEDYDRERLAHWFSGKRTAWGNGKDAGPSASTSALTSTAKSHKKKKTTGDILYPSLTKRSIARLEILFADNPNAPSPVLRIWAERLNATLQDVETWVSIQRAIPPSTPTAPHLITSMSRDIDMDTTGSDTPFHLPTPSESTSPEPVPQRNSTLPPSSISSHFPYIIPASASGSVKNEVANSPMIVDAALPPSSAPSTSPSLCSPRISHQVQLALASFSPSSTPERPGPKTPAEFNERFAKYELFMTDFLGKMENGSLKALGFHPEMASLSEDDVSDL